MRIIAGSARGRRLHSPPGRATRPILDSLKERLFSILGDRVEDAVVWDLFAGAGSLGLEALSRGAASCLFVELDRKSRAVLERNVADLGFGDAARVVGLDATRPERFPGDSAPGLVFADPPFPMVESEPEKVLRMLEAVARRLSGTDSVVMVRTPSRSTWPREAKGLETFDRREHGVNRLELMRIAGY